MSGNKVLLDANAVLRYLIEDVAEQASVVEQAVIGSRAEVSIEVLAEVVYVLQGVYGLTKSRIRESLSCLLEDVSCGDERVAIEAMSLFTGTRLDFVDCVLAAEHDINGREVLTFDKKLLALMKKLDAYR